jgi:hypothetical protein
MALSAQARQYGATHAAVILRMYTAISSKHCTDLAYVELLDTRHCEHNLA